MTAEGHLRKYKHILTDFSASEYENFDVCRKCPSAAPIISIGHYEKYLPILVEAATAVLSQMLGKDSLQRSWSTWSLNVANNTNNDHRRSFQDSDGLDNFLLVNFRARLVNVANNVSHSSLVSNESSQMNRLARIVLRESLYFSSDVTSSFLRSEAHRSVTGR